MWGLCDLDVSGREARHGGWWDRGATGGELRRSADGESMGTGDCRVIHVWFDGGNHEHIGWFMASSA